MKECYICKINKKKRFLMSLQCCRSYYIKNRDYICLSCVYNIGIKYCICCCCRNGSEFKIKCPRCNLNTVLTRDMVNKITKYTNVNMVDFMLKLVNSFEKDDDIDFDSNT